MEVGYIESAAPFSTLGSVLSTFYDLGSQKRY